MYSSKANFTKTEENFVDVSVLQYYRPPISLKLEEWLEIYEIR